MALFPSVFRGTVSIKTVIALCVVPVLAACCLAAVLYVNAVHTARLEQARTLFARADGFAAVYLHALHKANGGALPLGIPAPERSSFEPEGVTIYDTPLPVSEAASVAPDVSAVRAGRASATLRAAMERRGNIHLVVTDYLGLTVTADASGNYHDMLAAPDIADALAGTVRYALHPSPDGNTELTVTLPLRDENEIYGAMRASAAYRDAALPAWPVMALCAVMIISGIALIWLLFICIYRPIQRIICGKNAGGAKEVQRLSRRVKEAGLETAGLRHLIALYVRDFETNGGRTIERLQEALKDNNIPVAEQEAEFLRRLVRASALYTEANVADITRSATDPAPVADSLAGDTPPPVLFNNKRRVMPAIGAGHLRIILAALYDNAARAGATLVKIDVFPASGNRVRMVVTDNGRGVVAHVREHMFRPFYSTKQEGERLPGLGLSAARLLATRYGGELTYEPSATGAVFAVMLPAS